MYLNYIRLTSFDSTYSEMVCQKITGINILGVIYTLRMSVDGNIVDLAKCAARYASFGSTDDRHDTYHSLFLLLCVLLLSNKTFNGLCKFIKLFKDLKINGVEW